MLLSNICIKKPVFAMVLSIFIVVLGAIFFTKLQIRGTPDIAPPIITVQASYQGADALYMEQEITTPIEKELRTIKHLDFISSSSSSGSSSIVLSFKLSTDLEIALNDVRSKISEMSYQFPDDMQLPLASKIDVDAFPSIFIAATSDIYDKLELTQIIQDNITPAFEKLSSVGQVNIFGDRTYLMRIAPKIAKMHQYQITPMDIELAAKAQNKNYPAGRIKTDVSDFIINLDASLKTPEEFAEIIVKMQGDVPVKLKDVADVGLVASEYNQILRYDSKDAIAIAIVKQSTSNIIELSSQVHKALDGISANLQGVKLDMPYDASVPIKASIYSVFHTIFEALVLTTIITYLFLASLRITLIPFVTIPISLISTFSVMYFLGFSINIFSLLAMILAIGLVVDDAIVMLENIYRYKEMGKTGKEAAIIGCKEISFTIISTTSTLACVFLPIGFIEGFVGKLFIEFAWTLAFCVIFSGFVALTLTPMMTGKLLENYHGYTKLPFVLQKFEDYLQITRITYERCLFIVLRNRGKFLLCASSSVIVLVLSFMFVNKELEPTEDDSIIQISFRGPEGSSLDQTQKVVKEAEQVLSTYKDIKSYLTVSGWGGSNNAFAFVPLLLWDQRSESQEQIRDSLNASLSQIPGMTIFAMNPGSMIGGGSNYPVEFNLETSATYKKIEGLSKEFERRMKDSGILNNINNNYKTSTPTIEVLVNRQKAYQYGVGLEVIGSTIQYLISGKRVGHFMMNNDSYHVSVRFAAEDRSHVYDLKNILVRNNNNVMLPLEVVADIVETITVKSYNHYNNLKSIQISANLAQGHTIQEAIELIDKISSELLTNNDVKLEYLGDIKRMNESDSNMMMTFVLALVFIYLILSAQFNSFLDPLLIILSVPFSITGGVLALWLFNNSLNMYSDIGLVTLIGLITKNAILIIEFANQLKEKGYNTRDAILEASKLRLRPILMTSMATICGAIPLVIASGAGAAARNSIGIVIVGGMLIGTLFTIFVIPVLYDLFKKNRAQNTSN